MTYSKTVGQMTWRGEQPAAFKAGLAEFPANYRKDPVAALSTLSSVYHSYASHRLKKDLRGGLFRRLRVVFHIATLVVRANAASERMVRKAGGLDNLTVDQLDVRASVTPAARRFGAADTAARIGLLKWREGEHSSHSKALLLLTRIRIALHRDDSAGVVEMYEGVDRLVPFIEREGEFRQLARICGKLEEGYPERLARMHRMRVMEPAWPLYSPAYTPDELRAKREWATHQAEEKEFLEAYGVDRVA